MDSLNGGNAGFISIFTDKIIHDLLLGHPLIDHFANLILPFKATSHIAVLENERTFAGAGEILYNFVNSQGVGAGWGSGIGYGHE